MALTTILSAAAGALAGPWLRGLVFAHTVAYGQPPRSHCPTCGTVVVVVAVRGIVAIAPIGGHCLSCATQIGPPAGAVELLAATVLAFLAVQAPSGWVLAAWCWAGLFALALALIDVEVLRLPDVLTFSAGLGALVLLGAAAAATNQPHALIRSVLGGVGLDLLYLVPILSKQMNMGRGDGHLAFVIGACLGWVGIPTIVTATIATALISVLYVSAMLTTQRLRLTDSVPVGPIMLIGALAALTLA